MRIVLLIIVAIVASLIAAVLVMRNRQKQAKLKSGTFSVLQGNVDGHPMFAMIDEGLRNYSDKQTLPFFLSLSTSLINPTSDGLPTRSDADSLDAWEDAVDAELRSGGRFVYVGRVTWNGHRELLYYVDNQQPHLDNLKILSDRHSTRPFAFTCERDEKWANTDVWLHRP
jgi:hypothetical protein